MSCDAVPEGEYLFTDVIYGDPNLPISPDHARAYVVGKVTDVARSDYGYKELVVRVVGKVTDVARSDYGYKELVVQASSVKVQ